MTRSSDALLRDLFTALRAHGLPEPETEVRFHPIRRWRLDYGYRERLVCIEMQGSVFTSGHHTRGRGYQDDCEKLAEAQCLGWLVVPITSGMIEDGRALDLVLRAWQARAPEERTGEE